MQEETKAEVTRRSLIRRAGTVAVGVGAAGIAAAAIASPAEATDGQPVVQGAVNTGDNATTTIANLSPDKAALSLSNPKGVPLELGVATFEPTNAIPVGGVFADDHGALYTVGDKVWTDTGEVTVPRFYGAISPAFSTSTAFVTPERRLVTIPHFIMPSGLDGWTFITSDTSNIDGTGRVHPRNNNNVPDLSIHFNDWFSEFGIFGAQGTLLVLNAESDGFVSLYDTQVWPGSSSMNFQRAINTDGFTQMGFTDDGTINFKVSVPAVLVFDLFAFVVGNGTGRFALPAQATGTSRARVGGNANKTIGSPSKMPESMVPTKRKQ
jgi:hypothetical protein